jgi:hypothetical protein
MLITPTDEPVLNRLPIAVFVWSPMKQPTFGNPLSIISPANGTRTVE